VPAMHVGWREFIKAGAEKLGRYVEHDLRRLLGSHVLPVAFPGRGAATCERQRCSPPGHRSSCTFRPAWKKAAHFGAPQAIQLREPDPLTSRVLNAAKLWLHRAGVPTMSLCRGLMSATPRFRLLVPYPRRFKRHVQYRRRE
jgi:hypothetical protein